jgi:ribosomal protein S18 acetylase RimI-like enzyme
VVIFRQISFGSGQYLAARALRQSVLRAPLGLPLSDDDLLGEDSQLHFGLFNDDDELVACVIAVPDGAEKVRVRQTAVAPEYQRQGLASRMMRELEAKLRALGVELVTLHARQSAISFYRNLGYESVGPEFMEVTLPHQKMVKYLV